MTPAPAGREEEEAVIPALDWSTLTRSPEKVEHYRDEVYFRESLRTVRDVLGDGDTAAAVLRHGATLMMKPDGLAAGKLTTVHGFLADNGFAVHAVERPVLNKFTWRELWRYQLTQASLDRLAVNDLILRRPALLLALWHADPGDVPASVRLAGLKGPADVAEQWPGCLRTRLRQPAKVFSYVHVADEPVDVVRELGILLEAAPRARLLAALRDRGPLPAADRELLETALAEDRRVVRDMDAAAAVERAADALAALPDERRQGPAADRLRAGLDRMRAGGPIAWAPFAAAVTATGVKLDEWDLALLGACFMQADAPGHDKAIGSVRADDWRAGSGPAGAPRADADRPDGTP